MVTLMLVHISMQLNNGSSSSRKRLIESHDRLLGLREDQSGSARLLQPRENVVLQKVHFVPFVANSHDVLGDVSVCAGVVLGAHLDVRGILGQLPGDRFHLGRPSGRVERSLANRWQIPRKLLNLWLETHVQHAIRLI
eukprot:Skav229307  [mRNA]  locus=scaffold2942:187524:200749:+ [translate_table: standard]